MFPVEIGRFGLLVPRDHRRYERLFVEHFVDFNQSFVEMSNSVKDGEERSAARVRLDDNARWDSTLRFLEIPSDTKLENSYRAFYHATSNEQLKSGVCGVCGRQAFIKSDILKWFSIWEIVTQNIDWPYVLSVSCCIQKMKNTETSRRSICDGCHSMYWWNVDIREHTNCPAYKSMSFQSSRFPIRFDSESRETTTPKSLGPPLQLHTHSQTTGLKANDPLCNSSYRSASDWRA